MLAYASATHADAQIAATLQVPPANTEPQNASFDTSIGARGDGDHYVVRPIGTTRKLFVFLGGSNSVPTVYENIVEQAALHGYDALGLAYPNNAIVRLQCHSDSCYENLRGEVAFGRDVAYAPGMPSYRALDSSNGAVRLGDSIVNRLVCLIDYLSHVDAPSWNQYLIEDPASPYLRPSNNVAVYPDWTRIVLGGHSQGGGEAAFLAINLPVPVSRVVLLSSPQDTVREHGDLRPANWLRQPSRTPLSDWYGLRHAPGTAPTQDSDEAIYGDRVNANWQVLGGTGLPGEADGSDAPVDVLTDPLATPHRLFINDPSAPTPLMRHDSTAKDGAFAADVLPVWRYLLGD